ncbi:MAG: hypothetical protein ACFE9L_20575 [Candidatus Hodarchaeota archaeon]
MSKRTNDEENSFDNHLNPRKKADERRGSNDEFLNSYTRIMERRIRALETERQLLKEQRNKLEEERDNLKLELQKLRQPPLFNGILLALLENGKAIVKSSTGPLFTVVIDSSIPLDHLIPGSLVFLHQRNFAILEVLSKTQYPSFKHLQRQLSSAKESIEELLDVDDEK